MDRKPRANSHSFIKKNHLLDRCFFYFTPSQAQTPNTAIPNRTPIKHIGNPIGTDGYI